MITMGCGPGCDRRGNGFGGSDPELYRDGFGVSIGAGHYVKFGEFGNGINDGTFGTYGFMGDYGGFGFSEGNISLVGTMT